MEISIAGMEIGMEISIFPTPIARDKVLEENPKYRFVLNRIHVRDGAFLIALITIAYFGVSSLFCLLQPNPALLHEISRAPNQTRITPEPNIHSKINYATAGYYIH